MAIFYRRKSVKSTTMQSVFKGVQAISAKVWVSRHPGLIGEILVNFLTSEDGEGKGEVTAHIAGALNGIVCGCVVLKNFEEQKWEKKLKYVAMALANRSN